MAARVGGGRREWVKYEQKIAAMMNLPKPYSYSYSSVGYLPTLRSAVINWLIGNKHSSTATRAHTSGRNFSSLPQQQHHRVYQHTYQLCGLKSRLKCSELCDAKQPLWPAMCGLIIKATGKGCPRIAFQMQITRKVGFHPGWRTS